MKRTNNACYWLTREVSVGREEGCRWCKPGKRTKRECYWLTREVRECDIRAPPAGRRGARGRSTVNPLLLRPARREPEIRTCEPPTARREPETASMCAKSSPATRRSTASFIDGSLGDIHLERSLEVEADRMPPTSEPPPARREPEIPTCEIRKH